MEYCGLRWESIDDETKRRMGDSAYSPMRVQARGSTKNGAWEAGQFLSILLSVRIRD